MVSFEKLDRMRKRDDRDDSRGTTLADRLYSASSDAKRHKPMAPEKFMRRTVCRFWKEGTCHKGEKCTWAHGDHEVGTLVEVDPNEVDEGRPNIVKRKEDMTPPEAAVMAKLEAAAQERDRVAAMEAAGNGDSSSKTRLSSWLAATPATLDDMVSLQEMHPTLDIQAYQQKQLLQATQKELAHRLMEVEARGTPAAVVELQAKAMAMGTFGFGVGPLGELDLSRENSSPFVGKGLNKTPKQPLISTHRVYMGIVKAWYASQKHGRIECDEIRGAIGSDIYVYKDVLARASAGVGDVVCFSVFASPRGQLQASSPMVRTATHLGFALTGIFRTGGPCDRETESGTIDCAEVRRVFGTEARVPKEMGKGLIFGRRVAFNAYMNNEGKVVVVSVDEVDEGFTPTPGNLDVTYTMPTFAGAEAATQMSPAVDVAAMPFAMFAAGPPPPPPPPGCGMLPTGEWPTGMSTAACASGLLLPAAPPLPGGFTVPPPPSAFPMPPALLQGLPMPPLGGFVPMPPPKADGFLPTGGGLGACAGLPPPDFRGGLPPMF